MTDKGLNVFDNYAAECTYIYICPQEEQRTSSFWGYSKIYTPGTIANLQIDRALTKISKNGTAVRLRF